MKTVADLNSQWWYRLVKIIYILIWIFLILLLIIWVGAENEPRTFSTYKITCNYGNKDTFIGYARGIYLIDLDIKNGISSISDYKKGLIQEECKITEQELNLVFDATLNKENPSPLFTVNKTSYTEGRWSTTIFFQILTLVIALSAMELIRRCFYYVLLGSFRPSKS